MTGILTQTSDEGQAITAPSSDHIQQHQMDIDITREPTPSQGTKRTLDDRDGANLAWVKLYQEGGMPLMHYLLEQADIAMRSFENDPPKWAVHAESSNRLPNSANVWEWQFCDIKRLPLAEQKAWEKACQSELESLRERDVFDLVDAPKDRKIVQNRWVFDIKSDGRKKAHLVAKGFSQIEGFDFNEIFSPVVCYETV